jgi:KUP system potassium uptake protein
MRFGFIEVPNLMTALMRARELGCPIVVDDAVFFTAHDEVVRSPHDARLGPWQHRLFAFMYRNAVRASDRFDLPAERYLEIGRQIKV